MAMHEPTGPGQVGPMASQQGVIGARGAQPSRPAPRPRAAVLAAGAGLLVLAAACAFVIRADRAHPPVMGMDLGWLRLVRGARSTPATDAFKVLSLICGPDGATIIVSVLAAGLTLVGRWRTAIYLALAEAVGSTCSDVTKHFVLRLRPPHPLVAADIGSFPSGHVITTVGVGIALTIVFARPGRRRPALAAVGLAGLLMIFCRTYLAAHWLSDTFEGVLIATGVALLLWWVFAPLIERDRERPVRLPGWFPGRGPASRAAGLSENGDDGPR
jgi:membrane-associated phospholipid phosphatase